MWAGNRGDWARGVSRCVGHKTTMLLSRFFSFLSLLNEGRAEGRAEAPSSPQGSTALMPQPPCPCVS